MATVVKQERAALQIEYVRLRLKILQLYHILQLVTEPAGAREHKLPTKLGHWSSRHSDIVRDVHESLWPIVDRIEELRADRDPEQIRGQHTWLKRGHNFRRRRDPATRVQLNPGEWPAKWKK
jgi:hypothetical protein